MNRDFWEMVMDQSIYIFFLFLPNQTKITEWFFLKA